MRRRAGTSTALAAGYGALVDAVSGRRGEAGGPIVTAFPTLVAVRDGTRLVGRLGTNGERTNGERVTNALRLGAGAIASTILTDAIDLCWQPVVYRAEPDLPPAGLPLRFPTAG